MTVVEILNEELSLLKSELIAKYDEKGMRASGAWADSLEQNVIMNERNAKAQILGLEYSQQLETGRKSGKFPPIDSIKKWIVDKGISSRIQGEITISSLAFLIARKISREGWKRENYGGVNLISEVVTPQRIQKIIDRVGEAFIINVTDDIVKELQLV